MNPHDWYQAHCDKSYIAPLIITGENLSQIQEWVLELALILMCQSQDSKPCRTCQNCHQVKHFQHPDVHLIQPKGASRKIPIELARKIPSWMSRKSHSGGWSLIMIESADRMNQESSNALLKVLEEPTEKTLLILMSDQVESIISTIRSRCQKIHIQDLLNTVLNEIPHDLIERFMTLSDQSVIDMFSWVEQINGWMDSRKEIFEETLIQEGLTKEQIKVQLTGYQKQLAEKLLIELQKKNITLFRENSENVEMVKHIEKSIHHLKSNVSVSALLELLALTQYKK